MNSSITCKAIAAFVIAQFFILPEVTAQNPADSLRRLLENKSNTESRIHLYRELASFYSKSGNFDSSIFYYRLGIEESVRLKSKYWQTRYLLWYAGIYTIATRFDSAEYYYDKSLPLIEELKNDSITAQYYQNKGTLYMYKGQNEQSATYMIKSVEIMEKMKEKAPASILLSAYMNLSGIFNSLKQPEKALVFDKKALEHKAPYMNTGEYAMLYFNLANTYYQLNENEICKKYLDSARLFNKQFPNSRAQLNILGGLGNYFERIQKQDSALSYFKQALAISKESGDLYFFTEYATSAAGILLKQQKNKEGEQLLQEALIYAKEFNDFFILAEIYKGLKEIAVRNGNFKKAYEYSELSRNNHDSASSLEIKNTVLNLEARYENKRKETEIANLQLSNKVKELAVLKRNRWLIIGSVSSVSLLLLLGLLYRNSRQKQIIAEKDQKLKEEQIKFLERQQQVVSLQSMINGQETERTRIAKDLHDGLGGLFSTIKMYFSTLQHEKTELKSEPLFTKSYDFINTASEEVRRIAHNMMPEVLIKLGLIQASQELCNSISAGKLLNVSMQSYGMEKRLNASTEVMLFRILQELLNNIIKHAEATEAIIQFNREGNRLSITVEDNGRGFNLAETDGKTHAGLSSVESRVNYLNGKLSIDSQKEVGTTVLMDFLINE